MAPWWVLVPYVCSLAGPCHCKQQPLVAVTATLYLALPQSDMALYRTRAWWL